MHAEAHNWEDRYRDAFESVGPMPTHGVTIPNWNTRRVLMSHFPYQDSEGVKLQMLLTRGHDGG
jgi:hypothetical protein